MPGKGWRLSEAYDVNPVPIADGLTLNITQADNALDLDLAREVSGYFRVSAFDADEIIEDFKRVVGQWRIAANGLQLSQREQDKMASAFRLAQR